MFVEVGGETFGCGKGYFQGHGYHEGVTCS